MAYRLIHFHLHMAQLMPLPLTVSCFTEIHIGFTFLVPAHPGSPGQRAVKRARVCVTSRANTSWFSESSVCTVSGSTCWFCCRVRRWSASRVLSSSAFSWFSASRARSSSALSWSSRPTNSRIRSSSRATSSAACKLSVSWLHRVDTAASSLPILSRALASSLSTSVSARKSINQSYLPNKTSRCTATIRCDKKCYFNVHSKADIVSLIYQHDNVALPAFTHSWWGNRSISPACRAHSSKPAAAGLLLWA